MIRLFLISLFIALVTSSYAQQVYSGGIVTATGFKINDPQPIDDRTVVYNREDLNGIPFKYPGLSSYVLSEDVTYSFNGIMWVPNTKTTELFSFFNRIGEALPKAGVWDSNIREIGNTVHVGDSFIFTYSGYNLPYIGNQVNVGWLTSNDGINWVNNGKLIDSVAEDPYLVKRNDTFFLYVEDKRDVPYRGIGLYISTNLNDWIFMGKALDLDALSPFEDQDVSSPTVVILNETFYLFYEARGTASGGCICVATSQDGINFTRYSGNPIIGGTSMGDNTIRWANNLVPNEMLKINDVWYLFFHGWNGKAFVGGVARSTGNFYSWEDALGTWQSGYGNMLGATMPFLLNNDLMCHYPVSTETYTGRFGVSPSYPFSFGTQTTGDDIRKVKNYIRDEILNFVITANRTVEVDRYDDSAAFGVGYQKIIKNNSNFILTLKPVNGVTIDGDTLAKVIPAKKSIMMFTTGLNAFETVELQASGTNLGVTASAGVITSSTGSSATLSSLSTGLYQKSDSVSGSGLWVFSNTAGSTGYPSMNGGGLKYQRSQSTTNTAGAFEFWKSTTNDTAMRFKVGIGTTNYSPYYIIASREWTAANYTYTPGYGINMSSNSISVDTSSSNSLATLHKLSLKQNNLSGTGLVKATSGAISYVADNSSNWNAAYNNMMYSFVKLLDGTGNDYIDIVLPKVTTVVMVGPMSPDAAGFSHYLLNSDTVRVFYPVAPPVGALNLRYSVIGR